MEKDIKYSYQFFIPTFKPTFVQRYDQFLMKKFHEVSSFLEQASHNKIKENIQRIGDLRKKLNQFKPQSSQKNFAQKLLLMEQFRDMLVVLSEFINYQPLSDLYLKFQWINATGEKRQICKSIQDQITMLNLVILLDKINLVLVIDIDNIYSINQWKRKEVVVKQALYNCEKLMKTIKKENCYTIIQLHQTILYLFWLFCKALECKVNYYVTKRYDSIVKGTGSSCQRNAYIAYQTFGFIGKFLKNQPMAKEYEKNKMFLYVELEFLYFKAVFYYQKALISTSKEKQKTCRNCYLLTKKTLEEMFTKYESFKQNYTLGQIYRFVKKEITEKKITEKISENTQKQIKFQMGQIKFILYNESQYDKQVPWAHQLQQFKKKLSSIPKVPKNEFNKLSEKFSKFQDSLIIELSKCIEDCEVQMEKNQVKYLVNISFVKKQQSIPPFIIESIEDIKKLKQFTLLSIENKLKQCRKYESYNSKMPYLQNKIKKYENWFLMNKDNLHQNKDLQRLLQIFQNFDENAIRKQFFMSSSNKNNQQSLKQLKKNLFLYQDKKKQLEKFKQDLKLQTNIKQLKVKITNFELKNLQQANDFLQKKLKQEEAKVNDLKQEIKSLLAACLYSKNLNHHQQYDGDEEAKKFNKNLSNLKILQKFLEQNANILKAIQELILELKKTVGQKKFKQQKSPKNVEEWLKNGRNKSEQSQINISQNSILTEQFVDLGYRHVVTSSIIRQVSQNQNQDSDQVNQFLRSCVKKQNDSKKLKIVEYI